MNIKEAVKLAMEKGDNTRIRRNSWNSWVSIEPTNTERCCLLCRESKSPANRWHPTAGDLIADDWTVI